MKRFHWILLGTALAGVCLWAGRLVWGARQDRVTLHVRNLPLAEVISRLERQTRETIVADSRLDDQVTLHVDDVPLSEVLDRIAMQVGALATAIHAVHQSPEALPRLRDALRGGTLSTNREWTQWAPVLRLPAELSGEAPLQPAGADTPPPEGFRAPRMLRGMVSEDRVAGPGPGAGAGDVVRMVQMGADGEVYEEVITPEKIVVESALTHRLRTTSQGSPDLETAQSVARTARAHCTTLYTLQKSSIASVAGGGFRRFHTAPPGSGPDHPPPGGPPDLELAERNAQRQQLSRFRDLTPEQRARRAREQRPFLVP